MVAKVFEIQLTHLRNGGWAGRRPPLMVDEGTCSTCMDTAFDVC